MPIGVSQSKENLPDVNQARKMFKDEVIYQIFIQVNAENNHDPFQMTNTNREKHVICPRSYSKDGLNHR